METFSIEILLHLEPGLLEVHDSIGDLDADGLDGHLDVERSNEALGQAG